MTALPLACCLLALFCPPEPHPAAAGLVGRLGSESFAVRERATLDLQALGRRALPALEAARESPDPEVRSRAARLVAMATAPPWTGPLPWLDQIDAPSHAWRPYLAMAQEGCPSHGYPWNDYREATRLWAVAMGKVGVPAWFLHGVLAAMAEREADYKRKHGMPPH